jgi:putative restriction endonuclease
MRSDLHRLFDDGYITIDPEDRKIQVSPASGRSFRTARNSTRCTANPFENPSCPSTGL